MLFLLLLTSVVCFFSVNELCSFFLNCCSCQHLTSIKEVTLDWNFFLKFNKTLQAMPKEFKSHCTAFIHIEIVWFRFACIYIFVAIVMSILWYVEFLYEMQQSFTEIWFARATQTIHCHHHYRQHVAFAEIQREQKTAALLLTLLLAIVIVWICVLFTYRLPLILFTHWTCLHYISLIYNSIKLLWNQRRYIHVFFQLHVLVSYCLDKIILDFVFSFHLYSLYRAAWFTSFLIPLILNCKIVKL